LVLALTLTACSAAQKSSSSSANGGDPNARTLPPITQLAIGIFRLEGTGQAVTAEQAGELLPMWQVYSSLIESDSASQKEIDALIQQIQDTMTKDQMKAIQDLGLTPQDMIKLMQEQGIQMAGPGGQDMNAEQIATLQALRQSSGGQGGRQGPGGEGMPGGGPDGGMPPDVGGMQGGPGGIARASGTQVPGAGARGGMDRIPTALLDALIKLLETRSAS
jgi:hypothetical protein